MPKLTREKFHEIVAAYNVLISSEVLDQIYSDMEKHWAEGEVKNPGQVALKFFIDEFKAQRKHAPIFEPQDTKRLKAIATQVGPERITNLICQYFQMRDAEFVSAGYPLSLFIYRISRVAAKLDTGQAITKTEAQLLDRTQTNANAFGAVLAKQRAQRGQ